MPDQNKIAKELSAEQLHELLDRCWKEPRLTLQRIADLAAEYGVGVSLMGATSFRDTTFSRHLQRIGKAAELAQQVAALKQAGAGHTIADAASAIISNEVLDRLVNRDPDEELDLDVMSKIVKRLRDSDSRVRALEHVIDRDQNDAAKKVLQDKELLAYVATLARDSSLNEGEKIARIRRKLFGERPADFAPVQTTGAEFTA